MRDYSEAPFLVIWEVTQACDLACLHCRASACPGRHPEELTTAEGFRLLEQIRGLGDPLLVFTGGDPLKRPDLFELLRHSTQLGLRTTITPSATPLLTAEAIEGFQAAGVARMAVSLDGPDVEAHDGFRGVAGCYQTTMDALVHARRIGLDTQVNTTVTRANRHRLPEIAERVAESGARLWSVFFLVPTGRALESTDLSADDYEAVFSYLYALAQSAPFDIKTTEAPHYRRFVAQRRRETGGAARTPLPGPIGRQAGINDGRGFLFISHTGEIYPSGFLPLTSGNVRTSSLAEVYRSAPLFAALRRPNGFGGKCGRCEFRQLCGGSRSRAYAVSGDPLAEEPRCSYEPAAIRSQL